MADPHVDVEITGGPVKRASETPVFTSAGEPTFVAYGHGVVLIMRDGGGLVYDLEQTDRLIEKLQLARGAAGRNTT